MNPQRKASFKDILKQERESRGWTQQDLADKLMTPSELTAPSELMTSSAKVSRWERGIQQPALRFRTKLSVLFGLSLQELGLEDAALPTIFLSSSDDPEDAQFLAQLKKDLQLYCTFWKAEKDRRKSVPPEETLRKALHEVQALVLLASPNTRTPEIQHELILAEQFDCPVFVLWIRGRRRKEVLPSQQTAVRAFDVIDARGQRIVTAIDELFSALEDLPPRWSAAPTQEPRNPYKGLEAFQTKNARDFFGREHLIEELVDKLDELLTQDRNGEQVTRLLMAMGPSGSGKSSVVLAGVLPLLRRGELPGSREWIYLDPPVRPGSHPLQELTVSLASHFTDKSMTSLTTELNNGDAGGLHALALQLVTPDHTRVVLVIDQFEELFTQTSDKQERQQFIKLLLTACNQQGGPLLVILTLRADFYDQMLEDKDLREVIERRTLIYTPTPQELRAAIEKPTMLPDVQVSLEPHLSDQLLDDVQGQQGVLPLLQFTLEELFHLREGDQLTLNAYRELGGVKGALRTHAERVYGALPHDEKQELQLQQLARSLFLRLVDAGPVEPKVTSLRRPFSEFIFSDPQQDQLMQTIIERFARERLLTVSGTTSPKETDTVEVSHEALLSEWPRLATWIQESRKDIQLQKRIREDASEWAQTGKKEHLYRDHLLKDAKQWKKHNNSNKKEEAFLRASRQAHTRRLWSIAARVILLFILVLGTTSIVAWAITRPTKNITVTTLKDAGSGSLRDALNRVPPEGQITFAASLKGTIFLQGNLAITKDVTIAGPGADALAISGGTGGYQISIIHGIAISISGLAFTNTTSTGHSFLYSEGALTLINSTVSDNKVRSDSSGNARGGGIDVNGGTLTLTHSTVSGNTVSGSHTIYGGGIYIDSNNNACALTLMDSTISNNAVVGNGAVSGDGGGIDSEDCNLTLMNSTILNNKVSSSSSSSGGGIAATGGTFKLINSKVSGNTVIGSAFPPNTIEGGGIDVTNDSVRHVACTLTLIQSQVSDNTATNGKGASLGGGISGLICLLTLTDTTVSGNKVIGSSGLTAGGGINAEGGDLKLVNSMVSSNNAINSGTGFSTGGGISDIHESLTLTRSIISHNTATGGIGTFGGGIFNSSGPLALINNSTISQNIVSGKAAFGGGIYNPSTLNLTNSTVSDNAATGTQDSAGGGIATIGIKGNSGPLTLTNSTISDNTATGNQKQSLGGGIAIYGSQATLTFCTIYGNLATSNGGGIGVNDSNRKSSYVMIKNTLIGGNQSHIGPDISGSIISEGYNLIGDVSTSLRLQASDLTGIASSNLGIDSKLRNNGGPTQTLALLVGSPAIDKIPVSTCDISTDQRGVTRPQGTACDIGAFEYVPGK